MIFKYVIKNKKDGLIWVEVSCHQLDQVDIIGEMVLSQAQFDVFKSGKHQVQFTEG